MKKILLLLLPLIAALNGVCAAQITDSKAKEIKTMADMLAESYNIPDFAVTIVSNDSTLMTYEKNPENAGKNYLIGSCSKSLTALAIMRLAQEKMIDLDAPVKKYLPWFKMKNPDFAKKVTIRNLLNHKSGFTKKQGYFDRRSYTLGEYELKLVVYLKKLDVKTAPGTVFEYSNLNYILLGLIVRHVTGNPYAHYMEQYILPQAGMDNTWMTGPENNDHNLIQPYQYSIFMVPSKSRFYFYSDHIVPAGYISTNIYDAGNYLKFMLNGTVSAYGDTLLRPEYFNTLTGIGQTGYAMGWFAYNRDSMEIINHTGLDENYSASFAFIPKAGIGIAILCNINSLEFCSKLDGQIQSILFNNKPMPVASFSFEKFMRWTACILPILLLLLLIFNMRKWIKNEFQIEFISKWTPNIRLFTGVAFSLVILIGVTSAFQMHLGKAIRFSPDIAWGLILIAVLGIMSSFARYFGNIEK